MSQTRQIPKSMETGDNLDYYPPFKKLRSATKDATPELADFHDVCTTDTTTKAVVSDNNKYERVEIGSPHKLHYGSSSFAWVNFKKYLGT